jgi:hypothetical protein
MPLIRALEKSEATSAEAPLKTADPATASLFFLNPTLSTLDVLFDTRIRRLREFALRPVLLEGR